MAAPGPVVIDPKEKKKLTGLARKAARRGEHREAGELYVRAGELKEAVRCYLAASDISEASVLLARAGDPIGAAKLRENLEEWSFAGDLYRHGKAWDDAARCFDRAHKPAEQARVYIAAGQSVKAAQLLEKLGLSRMAAWTYAEAGEPERAAAAFRSAYEAEVERFHTDSAVQRSVPVIGLARMSGRMLAAAGKLEDGVAFLESAGLYSDAAEILKLGGQVSRAADYLVRSGRLLEAAAMLDESGEKARADELRGDLALSKGQKREAIRYYERAGQFERAGQLYEESDDPASAARMYEMGGQFDRAADLHRQSGDSLRAAQAFEKAKAWEAAAEEYVKAKELTRATQMLEQAGRKFQAADLYIRRGRLEEAIRLLQELESDDTNYRQGKSMLGDIFREKGMFSLAIKSYQLAVGNDEVTASNIEAFYQMAACHEREGNLTAAAALFERILVRDYLYKDTQSRLQSLKRQIGEGSSGRTTTGGRGRDAYAETMFGAPAAPPKPKRYRVESELGRGGMGIVYKAHDTLLDRETALKVLPPHFKAHPQALEAFFREAKAAAAMNHPNIVTIYDMGEDAGDNYIAMEFVDGQTLREVLNQQKLFPVKAALLVAGQICRALEYAHGRRVIHRDIKPANIMWTKDKQVKIMDFGLAKVVSEVQAQQTIVAGTPYYMSPEQTLGEGVDYRTDIYSTGVTLFELLTGRVPFKDGDVAYHHMHTPPPAASSFNPKVSPALDAVIQKAMSKNKEERHQGARALFDDLKSLVDKGLV
ncbi:MAG: protein kinase [Deltaproteobacteria bacterium]|nr:protein kinase [Deltaproteobacteria bacterium]